MASSSSRISMIFGNHRLTVALACGLSEIVAHFLKFEQVYFKNAPLLADHSESLLDAFAKEMEAHAERYLIVEEVDFFYRTRKCIAVISLFFVTER